MWWWWGGCWLLTSLCFGCHNVNIDTDQCYQLGLPPNFSKRPSKIASSQGTRGGRGGRVGGGGAGGGKLGRGVNRTCGRFSPGSTRCSFQPRPASQAAATLSKGLRCPAPEKGGWGSALVEDTAIWPEPWCQNHERGLIFVKWENAQITNSQKS